MSRSLPLRALLAMLLLAAAAVRVEAAVLCPVLFAGGQPPALLNPKLAARTHGLCFDAFAVCAVVAPNK